MSMASGHVIEPGGLSDQDYERIIDMAAKGIGLAKISRTIRKHPSTVQWFMYRNGLKAPKYGMKPYMRGGRMVMPFSPEEDAFIEALRVQDFGFKAIAELATKRFGHKRSDHTIRNRLVMLAAREDAA